MLDRRIGLYPGEKRPVSQPSGDLRFQNFGINAGELKKPLVHGTIVMIFAGNTGDFRPALVEHAREDDVAAETDTRTARRALGQIRSIGFGVHSFCFFLCGLLF